VAGVLVFRESLKFQVISLKFSAGGGPNKTHVGNKVTALGKNTEDLVFVNDDSRDANYTKNVFT